MMSLEGQLVGMPLAGPESFSQQQLDYLKRALGVDETVLWEGSLGPITSNGTLTLSETPSNFEKLRFEYNPSAGGAFLEETCLVKSADTGTILSFSPGIWTVGSQSDYTLYIDRLVAKVYDTTPTTLNYFSNGVCQSISGSSSGSTNSRGVKLLKIVGIHRIAGGN